MKNILSSFRDKNGPPSRSRSLREDKRKRHLPTEFLKFLPTQPGSATQREISKIEETQKILERMDIFDVSDEHIRDVLAAPYAEGDLLRAAEFIDIEQKTSAGIVIAYNPNVHMRGAVNRGFSTCYLDSLLFSMFAKLQAFECMLKLDFPISDPRAKLVYVLRLYVNMLRSGKLIEVDLTQMLQETLAECGWAEAASPQQQDTTEAFAFLTETLKLPLLSLQVDLFHQGKAEADDHKVVYERLLNLAVPSDPGRTSIRLEDCLEEYFNAQIDVSRVSEVNPKPIPEDRVSITRCKNPQLDKKGKDATIASSMVSSPIQMSPTWPEEASEKAVSIAGKESLGKNRNRTVTFDGAAEDPDPTRDRAISPTSSRHRSPSLIQRIRLDDKGRPSGTGNGPMSEKSVDDGSTVVKAVTIPAWQFFRLIPWNAVNNNTEPRSNSEVALNFDQKPVVGICLKRYSMSAQGVPQRNGTYIDIPDSLRLPHFMLATGSDVVDDSHGLESEYKLVLQSVICHRGESVHSGHYISFARVAPRLLVDNRRHEFDPPPDYEEARWVRFDDMDGRSRVTPVDSISVALQTETPYLIFYQVVPRRDEASNGPAVAEPEPPSYDELVRGSSFDVENLGSSQSYPTTPKSHPKDNNDEPLFKDLSSLWVKVKSPGIRLSTDVDTGHRKTQDGQAGGSANDAASSSRRHSVSFSDSGRSGATPILTPEGHSPVIAPEDEPMGTASRLSRAASRFTLMQSRAVSSSGDNRLTNTMSRLGLYRSSREALAEPGSSASSRRASAAALDPDGRKSTSSDLPSDDKDKDTSHLTPTPKTKHKRNKSKEKDRDNKDKDKDKDKDKEKDKEKGDKDKPDSPDRECIVM